MHHGGIELQEHSTRQAQTDTDKVKGYWLLGKKLIALGLEMGIRV